MDFDEKHRSTHNSVLLPTIIPAHITAMFQNTVLQILLFIQGINAFIQRTTPGISVHVTRRGSKRLYFGLQNHKRCPKTLLYAMPKAIIFDLDGCLWRPEMYELLWYSRGKGSPFRQDPQNPEDLLSVANEPVYLLGDVREVLTEIYNEDDYQEVKIGISSRTDEPNWAKELLSKFTIQSDKTGSENGRVPIEVVFNGPIEIAQDSKVEHFRRISKHLNIGMEEILFFDNEIGNCRQVAGLGVTVAHCPDGVTYDIWNRVLKEDYPRTDGVVC